MRTFTCGLALVLVAGCTTLPGYQGGPAPRSTQYTFPGTGPVPGPAEQLDGGVFVFGIVFSDGSTATSITRHESLALCERERTDYAALATERVKEGAAPVMTVKCHRAHEVGGVQSR